MKVPYVDKALSVLSFLNGTGTGRGNLAYQRISGSDADTVFQVMVR